MIFHLVLCYVIQKSLVVVSIFYKIVCDIENASYRFLKHTDVLAVSSWMTLAVEEGLNIFNESLLQKFQFRECP